MLSRRNWLLTASLASALPLTGLAQLQPAARPEPARLLETRWPDGRKLYIGSNGNVNYILRKFMKPSNLPYFEPGVTCHLLVNDRSKDWRDLYQRARRRPVLTR